MFRTLRHLLPTGQGFWITLDKTLRQIFEGVSESFDDARDYIDLIWLDMFPEHTRELVAWEQAFGLKSGEGTLTEQERRDRLAGLWAAQGGQDPRYLQDTLRSAGFDVYVHEAWTLPKTDPPTIRDPNTYVPSVAESYILVNKLYTVRIIETTGCGEPLMLCGEPLALCGENDGFEFDRVEYAVPSNSDDYPYVTYIGGETFPDPAFISENRMDEFEDLVLKIYPQYLWIAILGYYGSWLIDDASSDVLEDDDSGDLLFDAN